MFKVIEVDQWTASGNITSFRMSEMGEDARAAILKDVEGGDSEAAQVIFGAHVRMMEVNEEDRPSVGNVWFKEGPDGFLERYRSNYDSSG